MQGTVTLSSILSERAKTLPRKKFISFGKKNFTYGDIDRRVSLVSGGLRALGLSIQDRAAILMNNCPEYIVTYFAILRAGGISIPVNTFLVQREISYILRDSGCKVLIYSRRFEQVVREVQEHVPDVRVLLFDEIPLQGSRAFEGSENDVAALLYTSGTTGTPKGVMLTHRNLISNAEACMNAVHFTPADRVLLFLPLFHSFSFTVCVLVPLYCGARIVLLESVKPFSLVLKSIVRDRITFFIAVPAVYSILSKKKIPLLLGSLLRYIIAVRVCICGASALPEKTLERFERKFRIPLVEGYGLTEASPVVAVNPPAGVRKPGSVGLPLPGVEVAVVGENGERLPEGKTGELAVKGPNVMRGYFDRKRETDEVIKDGWLYTGDMAKIDKEGYIYIVDRKKDLIIVDGMNVYPREVEEVVLGHPSIEECAMVGVPDGRGSEITILFLKNREGTFPADKEIRNFLKNQVAAYKIPKRIVFVGELPKTATGKIKKNELRDRHKQSIQVQPGHG